MAGVAEYRNEQFIQQYEHIKKLELLTDEELLQVKRKRSFFETSIKSCVEIKPFIDYIKYEIALMKKFKQMEYDNESDGRALDRVMSFHVKDLFRLCLKKFQNKRKVWQHYIAFAKQKFNHSVTGIYQEMLRFHHKTEDYIEAAQHEMSKSNFTVAMSFLAQGMGNQKESSQQLVVTYIECSLKQGSEEDDDAKKATLLQASKFFDKFLRSSDDVSVHCQLLEKIQSYDYAMSFQNDVVTNMMQVFPHKAEVWDILARRHLDGLFYELTDENEMVPAVEKIPFEICLARAITIYDKALDTVDDAERAKIFTFYINKLLEIDDSSHISSTCLKTIRQALGRTLARGCKEEKLHVDHFLCCLKLRLLNMKKDRSEIEKMLARGVELYPNSMELYEIAIKFHLHTGSYDDISRVFGHAIANNKTTAIELYRFLCGVYLSSEADKEKARSAMLEAVNSSNKQVSEAFQPYYIEYRALTDGIGKAREAFNSLLSSKTSSSLSLDFFKMMIKMEAKEPEPNQKLISNCYERATEHFGKDNAEVSEVVFI